MSSGRHLSSTQQRARTRPGRAQPEQLLARVAFEVIWEQDLDSSEMTWTAGPQEMFGYELGEVASDVSWWRERVHPDDLDRVERAAREAIEVVEPSVWSNEYRFRRKDGSWAWVASRCVVERDEAGRAVRVVGAMIEISQLKEAARAEQALHESQRALRKVQRLLLEAEALGHTGSWEMDLLTGEVFNTDENARVFFGGDKSKGAVLSDYAEAVHPDDRERVMKARGELLAGRGSPDIEFRIIWPDGSEHVISGRATVVRDPQGRPVRQYGTNADVTERKRVESELARRAHQQSAIAQLTLAALSGDSIQPIFDAAVAAVAASLEVDHAMVLEALPEQGAVIFRATAGPWQKKMIENVPIPAGPGQMSWFSWKAGAPVLVEDLPAETRFVPCEILLAHGIKSGINVPIAGRERPFGVLGAHSTKARTFSPDEVNFVWSVANVLAATVERFRAADDLRENREQMRTLSRKLIEAQEAERRAVARELHDDFGQVLTALKLNLQRRERDEADSIALVDGAIARMRDLAQDLRPPLLDEIGLDASLRWYVERETRRAGLELLLSIDPLPVRPPPTVETTCFRLVQEALTNVIRHAQARRVEVEVGIAGGALQLVVRDDGKGFDVAAARRRAARGESQGLLSMQERVGLAGGELEIDSAPGRGTTLRVRLPLEEGRKS